jgi:hypothetical protein
MSALAPSTLSYQASETAQNSPAIPLITGIPQHRGLAPSRPPFTAPEGSLDGWTRCNTMQREGNGRSAAISG